MKRILRNSTCILLSTLLLFALLPAGGAAAAGGDALRDVVVAQAQAVATIGPWNPITDYKNGNMTEDQKSLYRAVGCRPVYYFPPTYKQSYVGMPYSTTAASLEHFKTTLDQNGRIPLIHDGFDVYGTNMNAFLTEVVSQVAAAPITGVKQALTSPALTLLLPGADVKAASSKAAVSALSASAVDAAYASLSKGDLLLAWNDGVDPNALTPLPIMEPNIHAMVVTAADKAAKTVTAVYPGSCIPIFTLKCSKCGAVETEGPAFDVMPKHRSGYNYKTHNVTDPTSSCSGEWMPVNGTTYYTQTLTYDQLAGRTEDTVYCGSSGYLPYTVKAYTNGAAEAVVRASSTVDLANIAAGFTAEITSNYRIVKVEAVLSGNGQPDRTFVTYPDWDAWSYTYSDAELDRAMLQSSPGRYTLKLNVSSGPVTDPATMAIPVQTPYSIDFDLASPSVGLRADTDRVAQGQDVTLDLYTLTSGLTGVEITLNYDSARFRLNTAAVQTADAKVTLADDGRGVVVLRYLGAALSNGTSVAKLPFTAIPSGATGYAEGAFSPFSVSLAQCTTKASPAAADLVPTRIGGKPISLSIGPVAVIHRDYLPGWDLVLAFCDLDGTATYDGRPMVDMSLFRYRANGESYNCLFAYIARNADLAKVSVEYVPYSGNRNALLQPYDHDVNQSGRSDLADAQAVINIKNGKITPEENMLSCILADIDRSGRVDEYDALALMRELTK